jgi:2-polyprenyl-6-methoxyphenol hydroxylase-like FAD-dependent oxidoreductase
MTAMVEGSASATDEPGPSHTPVLVVGAGPVGSVLALELASHGVSCMLVDRSTAPSVHPKMDYVNGRSMELLGRLGLTAEIREHGIAAHHPANFSWTLGLAEPPLAVWRHPSVAEATAALEDRNDGTTPAEAYQRVPGSLLESILRARAREHPLVDVREGWTFTNVYHRPDGVTATLVDAATRTRHAVRADYLAACDGARSAVRHGLGITTDNASPPTRHCSMYFRSSDPALRRYGRAFVTIAARGLTLVSRDEDAAWTGSIPLPADEPFTADPVTVMRDRLGVDVRVDEVLSITQWEGLLSVSTAYRQGAVFLVGDAAHQFYPTGGHGANTGIADAVDLGWKLAAVLHGWGGSALLDSYEQERRPVALFNREMCANLLEVWRRFGRLASQGAGREYLDGFLSQETYQLDNLGVHFGYRYSRSPVISHEAGSAPVWRWREIVATTWPGSRAPSVRLAGGAQLFDRIGPGYTLVDLSGTGRGAPLVERARRRGMPMGHLAVDDAGVRAAWERDLVLVRPDQHVAWRGDRAPADWPAVLDLVCGFGQRHPASVRAVGPAAAAVARRS